MESPKSQEVPPKPEECRWRWYKRQLWELFALGLARLYKTEYLGECDTVLSPKYINRHLLWQR